MCDSPRPTVFFHPQRAVEAVGVEAGVFIPGPRDVKVAASRIDSPLRLTPHVLSLPSTGLRVLLCLFLFAQALHACLHPPRAV